MSSRLLAFDLAYAVGHSLAARRGAQAPGNSWRPAQSLRVARRGTITDADGLLYTSFRSEPVQDSNLNSTLVAEVEKKEYIGWIKSYKEAEGYGFIGCNELQALLPGKDVFLSKYQVDGLVATGLSSGDRVAFKVHLKYGKPQAYDVTRLKLQTFSGRVKAFWEDRGYGFIHSEDAAKQHQGKDVFLHKNQARDIKAGEKVTFTVEVVNDQPQARNVKRPEGYADANIDEEIEHMQSSFQDVDYDDMDMLWSVQESPAPRRSVSGSTPKGF